MRAYEDTHITSSPVGISLLGFLVSVLGCEIALYGFWMAVKLGWYVGTAKGF